MNSFHINALRESLATLREWSSEIKHEREAWAGIAIIDWPMDDALDRIERLAAEMEEDDYCGACLEKI